MTDRKMKKLKSILDYYGKENQIAKTFEEMAELQQLLARSITKPGTVAKVSIASEIADVEIMLNQMKIAFDCEKDVEVWNEIKIRRQMERMAKE